MRKTDKAFTITRSKSRGSGLYLAITREVQKVEGQVFTLPKSRGSGLYLAITREVQADLVDLLGRPKDTIELPPLFEDLEKI